MKDKMLQQINAYLEQLHKRLTDIDDRLAEWKVRALDIDETSRLEFQEELMGFEQERKIFQKLLIEFERILSTTEVWTEVWTEQAWRHLKSTMNDAMEKLEHRGSNVADVLKHHNL